MSSKWSARSSHMETERRKDKLSNMDLQTIDMLELKRIVDDFNAEVAQTKLENILFERFLEKYAPELLVGINKLMTKHKTATRIQFATNIKSSTDAASELGGYSASMVTTRRGGMRQSEDAVSIGTTATAFSRSTRGASMRTVDSLRQEQKVGYTMRIEMANKETATVRQQTERKMAKTKTEVRILNAELEELKLSGSEAHASMAEFTEFVLVNGANAETKFIPSERLLTYCNNWIKGGNAIVETMRLKTCTLKQNCKQQLEALAIKEEQSGILRPIDFEQLEIERRQFQTILAEKYICSKGLKRVTANASLALAVQRKYLQTSEARLRSILGEKDKIQKVTEKFDAESELAEKELDRWQDKIDRLKNLQHTYAAPSIMDYMERKMEVQDWGREISALERKVNICKIKLNNAKKRVHQMQARKRREEEARKLADEKFRQMKKLSE